MYAEYDVSVADEAIAFQERESELVGFLYRQRSDTDEEQDEDGPLPPGGAASGWGLSGGGASGIAPTSRGIGDATEMYCRKSVGRNC